MDRGGVDKNMRKIEDIRPEGEAYHISLSKLFNNQVKDILGYISTEFGDPTFVLSKVIFEDGNIWVEGEHDLPYLGLGDDVKGYTEEILEEAYKLTKD